MDAPEDPVAELVAMLAVRAEPARDDDLGDLGNSAPSTRFTTTAPDWFGDRVFGGAVIGHAIGAASQTVDPGWRAHSLHSSFLGALRPGPIELEVERRRDGRTFATREVITRQAGRATTHTTVSFHRDEDAPDYQQPLPDDLPPPGDCPPIDDQPPPFEVRWIGPTELRADGSHRSTRRTWVRTISPLPSDGPARLQVAAFASDMTGTSFRPHSPGDYGTHADASIDHAVWFHRPFSLDEWVYSDFHVVASAGGRSTIRGEWFIADGTLVMSMAQELLIRKLVDGP